MKPPLVYHPDYRVPLGKRVRSPMSKYHHLRQALLEAGVMTGPTDYLAPSPVGAAALEAVHDAGYVERLMAAELTPDDERRLGLPNSPELTRRSCLAPAGTLLAARLALEHGAAANLAGGSHHAGPAGGAGFCVTNDVAVAAVALLREARVNRVLVIDADVHQGDGTAEIFADDDRVFTFSIHAQNNYPTPKVVSDLDIGLPDGADDGAYLSAFASGLDVVFQRFQPDLAFYNAGTDVVAWDRLGRLGLSAAGLLARDNLVFSRLKAARIPMTLVLGGGYGVSAQEVADRHVITIKELCRNA